MKKILNILIMLFLFVNIFINFSFAEENFANKNLSSFGQDFTFGNLIKQIKEAVAKINFGFAPNNTTELDDTNKLRKYNLKLQQDIEKLKIETKEDCDKKTGDEKKDCEQKKTDSTKSKGGQNSKNNLSGNKNLSDGLAEKKFVLNKNPFGGVGDNSTAGPGGAGAATSQFCSTASLGGGNYTNKGFNPSRVGMPEGTIAYQIGGASIDNNAKIQVVGFIKSKGDLENVAHIKQSGKYVMGYVNLLVEKGSGYESYGKIISGTSQQYGEPMIDFNTTSGKQYLTSQLENWIRVATSQKGIAVDVDNCDSIGWTQCKIALDIIQQYGQGKICGFIKNPHLITENGDVRGVEAFKHQAVCGAFVEEVDSTCAQKIVNLRSLAQSDDKIILFAGGHGSTRNMIENVYNNFSKIGKNIAASVSGDPEYAKVEQINFITP